MKGYKTLAFALALAVGGVLQTFDWATIIPQDKGWSGIAMLAVGAVVAALRYATSTPIGKALIAFLIVGIALMGVEPSRAADNLPAAPIFPIKAIPAPAPAPSCTAAGCSGAFLGAEFSGSGTGVNVLNLGSLSANGNYMGANGGYQFFNGTYWLSAEVEGTYDVAPPGGLAGGGFSNKLFFFEGVEVGGYLSALFNIAPINLPGPLAGAVPTIKIGACQNGSHLSGYCAGAAAHFFIPNSKFTVDVSYLNAQYGTSTIAPNATANVENRGTFGFSYHF